MLRLLFVLVVVAVGVTKEEGVRLLTLEEIHKLPPFYKSETEEERRRLEACWDEDMQLCKYGFLFTATALKEVRSGEDLEVLLTLEESLHPHVTFDVSLRTLGDTDLEVFRVDEEEGPEETVFAREKVTLGVNELRSVVLRVSDLQWRTAYLVVATRQAGHSEYGRQIYTKIQKVISDLQVFVHTDKSEYGPGDTVNYRVVAVDGNVDKTPKFAQVIIKPNSKGASWVEVPETGILSGNFTFQDEYTGVRVRVTSNVTSSDSSMVTTPTLPISKRPPDFSPSQLLPVRLEGLRDVSFPQPRVTGRVKLTSTEGFPLEGNCNVTLKLASRENPKSGNEVAERSLAVGFSGGEFEFDVVEELGAEREGAEEHAIWNITAKCRLLLSGSVEEASQRIRLWRSPFKVTALSKGRLPRANSSHPQTTIVSKFLVGRWDGRCLEEEERSKGLHVELLLSEENLRRLRPSATNFSLPIPPSGRVRLEFQVNDTPPSRSRDAILFKLGDDEATITLEESSHRSLQNIHVTPIDPARLIRRGDVVRFRVRSGLAYRRVTAVLSSNKAIYSSRRFSFSAEGEELDEVIELTIPHKVTEGTLNLLVFGLAANSHDGRKIGDSVSVKVNVVSSHEQQYIKIADQVDDDMSTIVTFRLEGMLADSVVYLQAAKVEALEDEFGRPLKIHENQKECENPGIKIRDYSLGLSDASDVEISANFFIKPPRSSDRQLLFVDVDRKTSTEDNGTFKVTKTFDRLTEFGTYVVSGATFNSKSGRTGFSNSPVLKIPPPPVTLSVYVAPSIFLGETVEVLGYVKNNLATPFEGHVTLGAREAGSTEVKEEFVKVNPNAFEILRMNVTPQMIGDLFVSLRSNISSRLTATRKVRVNPLNSIILIN